MVIKNSSKLVQENASYRASMEELLGKVGAVNGPKPITKARGPHTNCPRNCGHPLSQSTYSSLVSDWCTVNIPIIFSTFSYLN